LSPASPRKLFVLILPIIGLFIFTLPRIAQTKALDELLAQEDQGQQAGSLAQTGSESQPEIASGTLPTPYVETKPLQSANATPIAVTGLSQAVIPTPVSADTMERLSSKETGTEIVVPSKPDEILATKNEEIPSLGDFVEQVVDGQAGVVTGIYAAGVMALRIVQQPESDVAYISEEDGTATQFQSAAMYGVVGLLAHNFLSGELFYNLRNGQEIALVYGDGSLQNYRIIAIDDFERLANADLQSDFRDLKAGQVRTVDEVFFDYYSGEPHLTLQTCIEKDGVWNWGVRFIVAQPVN
jgi:hypothetical protein